MVVNVGFLIMIVIIVECAQAAPAQVNAKTTKNTVKVEEIGKKYQGDMILMPEKSSRGVAIRPSDMFRWPGGVIPYEIDANISEEHTMLIIDSMRVMERQTAANGQNCIQFREKLPSDEFYITVFNDTGCYATVGYWPNYLTSHPVSLFDSPIGTCMHTGIIQHELMHVLGFFHEQSRPDRDDYIMIVWENIEEGTEGNFEKYDETMVDTQMTPYDYSSLMHYDASAFSKYPFSFTIIPTRNRSAVLGQRSGLTPIDILEIQRYYRCETETETTSSTVSTSESEALTTETSMRGSSQNIRIDFFIYSILIIYLL